MQKRLGVLLTFALAAVTFVAACSDHSPFVAPSTRAPAASATSPSSDLLGGVTGTLTSTVSYTVKVVQRTVPLSQDVTWSFVASPKGTTSTNLATGLTISFPKGAVSAPMTITVTAKAGSPIDYQFQPQGTQFLKPVALTQDLSLTNIVGSLGLVTLKGAYYTSDELQFDSTAGTATVNEFEPTTQTLLPPSVTFQIVHFSGYTIAACDGSGF